MDGITRDLAGGRLYTLDRGPVREVRLSRPDVHDALDEELIAALTLAFAEVGSDPTRPLRVQS